MKVTVRHGVGGTAVEAACSSVEGLVSKVGVMEGNT